MLQVTNHVCLPGRLLPPTQPHPTLPTPTHVQVMLQVIVFAFLVIIGSAALLTPFLLYVLRLGAGGWKVSRAAGGTLTACSRVLWRGVIGGSPCLLGDPGWG